MPSLSVIGSKCLTNKSNIAALRREISEAKFGSNFNFSDKITLYYEKCSGSPCDRNSLERSIETYFPTDNHEIHFKGGNYNYQGIKTVTIENGDIFIGEIMPELQFPGYINGKE